MRLRILSDLHVECFQEGRDLPDVAADVVILAGDIHRTTEGLTWAAGQITLDRHSLIVGASAFWFGFSLLG